MIAKIIYMAMGLAVSVLGGVLASASFKRTWKLVAREKQAPQGDRPRAHLARSFAGRGVAGAVFGLVKAAVDRAGAKGFERATGAWPA